MTVNLSDIRLNDSSSFSKQLNGLTNDTLVIVANRQDLFEAVPGTANFTIVNLSYGKSWMNNDGDTVYLLNATVLLDSMVYISSVTGHSWSLCNGTWTETENATPGSENSCPEESGYVHVNGTDGNATTENATEVFDYSGIFLDVSGPAMPVRFGDFSQVKAVLHTGGNKVPLRIVTYIYKPHWVSVDLEGNNIHYYLNETQTALEIEIPENGEDVILHLPLFIKSNCDGEYENGVYTGNVRVYEGDEDKEVDEDTFNITISGNNPIFCCDECDDCDCPDNKCSCSTGNTYSATKGEKTEFIELLAYDDTVRAGVPFETTVRIENTENREQTFSVYSYAYEGSRCLSLGFDGSEWKKTWTANKNSFELAPGKSFDITLKNAFENGTIPGIYTFRIRLKYLERNVDITRDMKVTPAPEAEKNAKVFDDIEIITDGNEENDIPITGMAAAGKESTGVLQGVYEMLVSWLASVFKF